MPTSRITELRPNGGFNLDDGSRLNTFYVAFENGTYGNANTKGETPPYNVGDTMEYTITGNYKGTPKLKITKPGSSFGAPAPRSAAPAPVPPAQTYQPAESKPVNGATVGMAMNQAVALLTRDLTHDQIIEWVCEPSSWLSLMETCSDIIRLSRYLEEGHLAPSVKDRAAGITRVQAPPPPPPPPQPQPQQEPESDIPF